MHGIDELGMLFCHWTEQGYVKQQWETMERFVEPDLAGGLLFQ